MRTLRLPLAVFCLWILHLSSSSAQNRESLAFSPEMRIEVTNGWSGRQITRDAFLVEHKNASNAVDASMMIRVSSQLSHAQALQRLIAIRSQYPDATTYTLIGGWPGLERKVEAPFQRAGEIDAENYKPVNTLQTLTAVAVKDSLVRFDTLLQPGADHERGDEALAMARTLSAPSANPATTQQEIRKLKSSAIAPKTSPPRTYANISSPPAQGPRSAKPLDKLGHASGGAAAEEVEGRGEIDAAASLDGQYFVTDASCGISYSSDGGVTFPASNISGGPTSPSTDLDGDCGVAWGPSGTFYLSQLGDNPVEFVALYTSTDHGANFNYVTNAVDRSALGINVDQPHVATDHWNLSATNQDQLYVVWQETGNFVSALACSTDGGSTWGAPVSPASGNFGYPRVAVGKDGMVYVVSRSWPNQVYLDKFSSCASGLVEQPGFPFSGSFNDAYGGTCTGGPIAGLDRCNDGNTLASPVIAVDDTDPNHIYMALASMNASQTGQDILVQDSWDGGLTWEPPVAANGSATAVRFLSWLGTWGGTAYLGWYDRRFAGNTTADPDDFTRYYMGSVTSANGVLTSGPETDLMGIDDPQCASGWGNGTREPQDATSCTVQPQLAGYCSTSNARCDFSNPSSCLTGQTCNTASGLPKYGDYNTLAPGGGRLLNIWASGTAPSNLPSTGNNDINAYVVITDLPSDFFVRDWTTNASSHDAGQEPSTNPAFYVTSDVWNQTSSTVEPLVNDWVQGDAAVASGATCPPTCNYAFARISRRAPAAPTVSSVTVTADFLMADFGLGVPFADLGSQTVTFAPTDITLFTPGLQWSVPATASSHVCLAVQISAPGDAYLPPSLLGGSPGTAGTDPLVLQDNKKAQRNLEVVPGTGGAGGEFYAIVHNNEKSIRDIEIQQFVDSETAKFVSGSQVTIVNPARGDFAKGGHIFLRGMRPGEDRWLRLAFGTVSAPEGKSATYHFQEVAQNRVVNGFAIELKREPLASVVRSGLRREANVLGRFAEISNDSNIKRTAQESEALSTGTGPVDLDQYRTLLSNQARALLGAFIRHTDARPGRDPFGLVAGLWAMDASARSKDEDPMSIRASALMERLDAYLTWKRRATTTQATR